MIDSLSRSPIKLSVLINLKGLMRLTELNNDFFFFLPWLLYIYIYIYVCVGVDRNSSLKHNIVWHWQ
jgi:hypothetical protein